MNETSTKKNRRPQEALETQASSFGRIPPQNLDAEEAVLGAVLLEKEALGVASAILSPESFYREAHRIIFENCLLLDQKGDRVDLLTITNQLRKTSQLDFVGGTPYLVELTQKVGSAANLESHARIVQENALKREIIKTSSSLTKEAFDYNSDALELLGDAQAAIFDLVDQNFKKNHQSVKGLITESIRQIQNIDPTKGLTGVPTGFTALDRLTSGWQNSDLIIIAARPGMGKTAFVLSMIRNAAVQFKKSVAFFSLEMSSIQLVNRLISAEAEVTYDKLTQNKLSDYEWKQVHDTISPILEAPIYIDDTPALSILELRTKSRQLKAQYDIQIIIVDYLQLMRGTEADKRSGNREQEIGNISRNLKGLAKELSVPVIALSQLSRAVETRGGDKRPQLSDLRESGSIEQDADAVVFLYRPEYYGIMGDEEGNSTQGISEVIFAKHRNGKLDNIKLKFEGQFIKFKNFDHYEVVHAQKENKDKMPSHHTEQEKTWNTFPLGLMGLMGKVIDED